MDNPELQRLLQKSDYTRAQILLALAVSEKALEHMVGPKGPLRANQTAPGTGRGRRFSGTNILRLEVARRLSPLGLPHASSRDVCDRVVLRAEWIAGGLIKDGPGLALALYPIPTINSWACLEMVGDDEAWTPPVIAVIDVDRIIDEVVQKLRALRDGTPMPNFNELYQAALAKQLADKPVEAQRDFLRVATPGFVTKMH
jgi:hypothetical protein